MGKTKESKILWLRSKKTEDQGWTSLTEEKSRKEKDHVEGRERSWIKNRIEKLKEKNNSWKENSKLLLQVCKIKYKIECKLYSKSKLIIEECIKE